MKPVLLALFITFALATASALADPTIDAAFTFTSQDGNGVKKENTFKVSNLRWDTESSTFATATLPVIFLNKPCVLMVYIQYDNPMPLTGTPEQIKEQEQERQKHKTITISVADRSTPGADPATQEMLNVVAPYTTDRIVVCQSDFATLSVQITEKKE